MRPARALRRAAGAAAGVPGGPAAARPAARFPDQEAGLKLSLDEALYLAKEAGYWTTREVQLQIVRSPPFSPRDRPFLLENFFELLPEVRRDAPDEDAPQEAAAEAEAPEAGGPSEAARIIQDTIQRHFHPGMPPTFWHGGQEWLSRAEGHGTRKRAAAHAVLVRGTGVFKVNGESDMYARWPMLYHRFDVCQPFKLTGTAGVFDVFVEVAGGGPSGQAGAARLAVARALFQANAGCHDALQAGFCLLEDTRQKMSKMPGKKGRRASFAWSKR